MQEIIEDYSQYLESDKISFRNFLNEILSIEEKIKENKWKKTFISKEIEKDNINLFKKADEYLINKWIKEVEIGNISKELLLKEMFWVSDWNKESMIGFPVYLWTEINNTNDSIFLGRINILNYLVDKWIIKISNFNPITEINIIEKLEDEFINKLFEERKDKFIDKYWEDVTNRQIEWLKWKEKYFQFLIFERENINRLLQLIKEFETKEFRFENWILFYWWIPIYKPKEFSDRFIFLELFFSKHKWVYFNIKDIYEYIFWWEGHYLTDKESKKIYNLKDKINNIIYKKTLIEKTFSLWKLDSKGDMYRKY